MNGGIYLIQDDDSLVEMTEQAYNSEDLLQELLAKYPRLLAGDQIDSLVPRRWLLVSREMALPSDKVGAGRWSIDHLFLDQDAVPTIVEVKRSTDTRIRREVVGQMLDYAANAVLYWPIEEIQAQFESNCKLRGLDPERELGAFLGAEINPEEFWQRTKVNLQAGRIRLVFVADTIPSELRRVVEFLNEQMDPAEVIAIDIRQYVGRGLKALVPRVVGKIEKIDVGRQWDEPSFFQELERQRGTVELKIARKILDHVRSKMPRLWWGKGKQYGSVIPVLDHKGIGFSFIVLWTNGYIQLQFGLLQSRAPFFDESKRLELLRHFNEIQGIALPEDAINKYPSIPYSALKEEATLKQFLQTVDRFIQEIQVS